MGAAPRRSGTCFKVIWALPLVGSLAKCLPRSLKRFGSTQGLEEQLSQVQRAAKPNPRFAPLFRRGCALATAEK